MKLQIFSVYDSKAKAYLPPFFLPEIGMATRVFQNCANDKGHQFGANAEDYCLFHIGEFDDSTALCVPKTTPESLGLAQEFKKSTVEDITNDDHLTDVSINEARN